jgi:hypothetical protein
MKNKTATARFTLRAAHRTGRRPARRPFRPGCALLVFGLMIGCSSFPKPRSDKDTLFIVPYLLFNTRQSVQSTLGFSYEIRLENVETGKMYSVYVKSSDAPDYIYVTGFPEGKYLLKEYMALGLVGAPTKSFDVQKYLILEPGKLTIFPIKIIIYSMDSSDPQYAGTVYFDYKELDEKQEARMIKQLSAKDGFQAWRY